MNLEQLEKLKAAANFIGAHSVINDIDRIMQRQHQEDSDLILPLVGEFSSGKTSLINSLTDCKQLETATAPTTATIYEVHFGCSFCHAVAIDEHGNETAYDNITDLKNEQLANAKVVTVFDTSNKVSPTTVFVDTPGLSSPDPKHRQTLVDFLPCADALLLVVDINQQVTRSLSDFIATMKLAEKPIFLVLTKCDTKAASEITAVKQYIKENTKIDLSDIVAVSAKDNSLEELYTLLDSLKSKKKEIIAKADDIRAKEIAKRLIANIDDLLKASSSLKEIDDAIDLQQDELAKIQKGIARFIETTEENISDCERDIIRTFEDTIQSRLNNLVVGKSADFDNEAVSTINSTASLLSAQYRQAIKNVLKSKASSNVKGLEDVSLESLNEINLDSLSVSGLNYNLDLNSMGHQYDGTISVVAKIGVAVAAVAAVATVGKGAAGISTKAVSDVNITERFINTADTVSDVASIVSNQKTRQRVENAINYTAQTHEKMQSVEKYNQEYGQKIGSKGIVESMVGFVTDKTWGKPQRMRAIRNYLDSSLCPEFRRSLEGNRIQLLSVVRQQLELCASEQISQKKNLLQQMQEEARQQKACFEQRRNQLKNYKAELIVL